MRRLTILTTVVSSLLLLSVAASLAFAAETPQAWWHLTSGARPTYLHPGVATSEVQQLTVRATAGDVFVYVESSAATTTFAYNATHEEVQEALEKAYGEHNVEVTGGPEGKPAKVEDEPYTITFTGVLGGQPIATFNTASFSSVFGGLKYETEQGTAPVTELTKGKPDGELVETAENLGYARISGAGCEKVGEGQGKYTESACATEAEPGTGDYEKTPVKILDTLPPGLRATSVIAATPSGNQAGGIQGCRVVTVSLVSCEYEGQLPPFGYIEMRIGVVVTGSAPANAVNESEQNELLVEGGQAPAARLKRPVRLSAEPVPFGVETYQLDAEEEGGAPATHAGSHPFQITNVLNLNETPDTNPLTSTRAQSHVVQLARDLSFKWPAGLIGNPQAVPRCPIGKFLTTDTAEGTEADCPADTAVGVARVSIDEPLLGVLNETQPFFNLETEAGEPARFGFMVIGNPVIVTPAVRNGEDYGITVDAYNITQTIEFLSSTVTVWGDPGAPQHAGVRGNRCFYQTIAGTEGCHEQLEEGAPPFLLMPTSCPSNPSTGRPEQLYSSVEGDSWTQADEEDKQATEAGRGPIIPALHPFERILMPALSGCAQLPFNPSIEVKPDVPDASTSTGLRVDVHVPQEGSVNSNGDAEAEPRNITVALPAGVAVNPSGGDGLEACSERLVGYQGMRELATLPDTETPIFSPYLPGSPIAKENGDEEPFEQGVNFCPDASKIGEVTIHTPILPNPLTGFVYLAAQESNPSGSLLAMYVLAEDPFAGVTVKLPGAVQLCKRVGEPGLNNKGEPVPGITCEALGQLIATFENNPQAPFEDAEFHFFGGERAPLATPARCGAYTTRAAFTPWSASEGEAPHIATGTFDITSGPSGSPCPGASLPFSPSLTGGATNIQAGAFSPFTLTLTRHDGEQNMQSVEAHLPLGMSGDLSNIEQCPEPQANEGTCGPNSLIGETTVAVGVGGHPFTVSGGKFYLTGPYNGSGACSTPGTNGCAPFGITFEVPAKAGPFDLAHTKLNHPSCDCVLVRGKIDINPETAAITVTSNPPGTPDAIPTSIEGIPLEIQHINATTTRGNFQFNPTNCEKLQATGTIHSSEGATDTITVPFQVTNCADLKFEPKFQVSTRPAKDTRLDGTSLTAKLAYPSAPQGTFTNIARVKVELPKALPSRLNTLRKACTVAQFNANPAGCPPASKIGTAVVHTPILSAPLTGPAIFVSHGGEAWPTLTLVLQGDGVTVDLVGTTLISKAGVTSTTFKTVPDQPFSTFELTLPQGEYSALTTLGNLCRQKLTMPTEFIAQNGAVIHQNTKIAVNGCAKSVRHERKKKHHPKRKKK
jgi:hypothetical protein